MRRCRSAGATPSLQFMASLDVVENGCIARMLQTWPHLSRDLVNISSLATRVKMIAGVLTELLMAVLATLWLVRGA